MVCTYNNLLAAISIAELQMKNELKLSIGTLAVLSLLGACTTTDGRTGEKVRNNSATGAIIGAVVGAAGGYASNDKSSAARKNALIAAGVGAVAGATVGEYMDKQQAELRKKLDGTGVDVVRNGDEITLNMPGDVTYDYNKDTLQPRFYPVLNDVAKVLADYPSTYVDIVGHADSVGSDAYNLDLSRRRATTAANYITSQGVTAARLYVNGMGESQPIASNDTDEGRAKNRRVEIKLRPVT